jgi:hypothetical protein
MLPFSGSPANTAVRGSQWVRSHLTSQNFPMPESLSNDVLTIGLAQIAPVWMDRAATVAKVESYVDHAVRQRCRLVVFGEAVVPGYPFWLEPTGGARFNSPLQKAIFAEYAAQAVQLEAGHLDRLCRRSPERRCHLLGMCGAGRRSRRAQPLLLVGFQRSAGRHSLGSPEAHADV